MLNQIFKFIRMNFEIANCGFIKAIVWSIISLT